MTINLLPLAAFIIFSSPVAADSSTPSSMAATDAVWPGKTENSVLLIVTKETINNGRDYERVRVPASEVESTKHRLLKNQDVIRVEKDVAVSGQAVSGPVIYNDEFFQDQSYFDSENAFSADLSEAHERLEFLTQPRVGIIDSGFFDTTDVSFSEGANFVPDPADRDNTFLATDVCVDPATATNHGHYVAQLIGASADNGIGIAGAAINADLVAGNALDCNNDGSLADVADAIRWMAGDATVDGAQAPISEPVDLIVLSFGTAVSCPTFLQDAIDFAKEEDIALVASAGNDGADGATAPGNCAGVIAAASTTSDGQISTFSNFGDFVDIAAQGEDVRVLRPDGSATTVSGTSYSAAIVTGIFAAGLADRPDTTGSFIDLVTPSIIRDLADPADNVFVGSGLIDANLYLDELAIARAAPALTESVLVGERERFQDVYTHPSVRSFLQVQTSGGDACSFQEIDGSFAQTAINSDQLAIFTVPEQDRLDPQGANANTVDFVSFSNRILFQESDITALEGTGVTVAAAYCAIFSGDGCNVQDSIRRIDSTTFELPAVCD